MYKRITSPEDYIPVKVNSFGRLLFYTRQTLHCLVQYMDDVKILDYDTLYKIMNEVKPHPVSVDLEDIFIELPEGRLSAETQKRYVDNIKDVRNNPKSVYSVQFVYMIMTKINECLSRLFSAVRTLYVYHIGWRTNDDTDIAIIHNDEYISTFLEILDNIYKEFRPLDIIFEKIYWSFIFSTPIMKQYYKIVQDIYWRIFGMESHVKNNNSPDWPDTKYKLYIRRNHYDANESITWNVGRGFNKSHAVLDHYEFDQLTTPTDYSSDDYIQ